MVPHPKRTSLITLLALVVLSVDRPSAALPAPDQHQSRLELVQVNGNTFDIIYRFVSNPALSQHSVKLLRSLGIAVLGGSGDRAAVDFLNDGKIGAAWIDSSGQARSLIRTSGLDYGYKPLDIDTLVTWATTPHNQKTAKYSPDQALYERRDKTWVTVPGKFEKLIRETEYEGAKITATFHVFSNADLSEHSRWLLGSVGCGTKGEKDGSRVRVKLSDDRSGVGLLDPAGNLKILSGSGWEEPPR